MEKKNLKLKNDVSQLIAQVSKLYKEISSDNNESYYLGKKDAFEEMLNWFVTSHNGDLKYISANSFLNMVQEKLSKTKAAMNKNVEDVLPEEDIKGINFSDIKITDNKKRRYPSDLNEQLMMEDSNYQVNNNFNIQSNVLMNSGSAINNDNVFLNSTSSNNGNSLSNPNNTNPFPNNQPGLFMPKKKKFK